MEKPEKNLKNFKKPQMNLENFKKTQKRPRRSPRFRKDLDEPAASSSSNDDSDIEILEEFGPVSERNNSNLFDSSVEEIEDLMQLPAEKRRWWQKFVSNDDHYRVELGGKFQLLFDLIRKCERIGDKL